MRAILSSPLFVSALVATTTMAQPASAEALPELPPPQDPGQSYDSSPSDPGPAGGHDHAERQPPAEQGYPPAPQYARPPPPMMIAAPPEPRTHAPKYALWTGARLSYVGFGFSFYKNERGQPETTGNFLGSGLAPQIDVGARISYRYIPYVFWEHGFMASGHRFAGADASSSTDFYGVGFRYVSGDVDSVAFLSDLSIGRRVVSVSNGSQSYSMSGLEYFRLGLGAEIRLATLFTLTPVFSISSGALNDTEGTIDFACAPSGTCGDGLTEPRYREGAVINDPRAYVVLSFGVGLHFDLLGK